MAPRNPIQPSNASHTLGDYVERVQIVDGSGNLGSLTATVADEKTATAVTQTTGGVSVTTASTSVLAANATRKGLAIVNTGTAGVTLTLGATATALKGIWLSPNGGSWDGLLGSALWTGSINGISDAGTNVVSVVEV